jgi:hypothetical protein
MKYDDDNLITDYTEGRPETWLKCSRCLRKLELLKNFELHNYWDKPIYDETGSDSYLPFGNRYDNDGCIFGIFTALGCWIYFGYRRIKLSNLKKKILPDYPASWVCPECLMVDKRTLIYRPQSPDDENDSF